MFRLSIIIALLSLFAVSAFAQQADTTAVKQQADTTAAAVKQQADSTAATVKPPAAPAAVVAPTVAPAQTAPPQTTPPPTTTAQSSDSGRNRRLKLGAGVHYMETIGDIKDAEGFDSGALNLLLGAKLGLGLITIEGDSEWALDYGGSDHTLWLPQVFALVGLRFIYLGAGVGIGYLNQEWFDHPTYALRAGLILPLGPVAVDLNANYQFMNSSAFDAVDSEDLDSITFGAIVWF
jgi:hypothetical protein